MTRLRSCSLARDLAGLFAAGTMAHLTDGQLLDQFISRRNEHAFSELVARHGRMVLPICRRSPADPRDGENAFRATFLILLRKARSLRDRDAVSDWL